MLHLLLHAVVFWRATHHFCKDTCKIERVVNANLVAHLINLHEAFNLEIIATAQYQSPPAPSNIRARRQRRSASMPDVMAPTRQPTNAMLMARPCIIGLSTISKNRS